MDSLDKSFTSGLFSTAQADDTVSVLDELTDGSTFVTKDVNGFCSPHFPKFKHAAFCLCFFPIECCFNAESPLLAIFIVHAHWTHFASYTESGKGRHHSLHNTPFPSFSSSHFDRNLVFESDIESVSMNNKWSCG